MTKKVLESEEVKEAIAKALGVSQSTISRLIRQEDMGAFIELEALKVLGPLVYNFWSIPRQKARRRDLAYRASLKILENAAKW
jgi:hypothetical protein